MSTVVAARLDTSDRKVGLVLAFGGLLVVVDTTVTLVAIPAMVAALDSSLSALQWVTTGYVLGLVAVTPLAAWTATRFGDRRVYLAAVATFVVLSVLAGSAWGVGSLIAFRVLQGLAGGLINPVGAAIALRFAPVGARGAMMSLLGLPVVVGPVLGPPLAGLLVDATSWRWLFWVNLPVGLVAWLLCRRVLPVERRASRGRVDVVGASCVAGGAASLVFGCTLVADSGRITATACAAAVLGALLLALFVRRALRQSDPPVRVRLLATRQLGAGAFVLFTFGAAYFGSMGVLPAFVQGVRGDPVAVAGALAVPTGVAVGLTLQVATRLVDRTDPHRIVVFGTVTAAVGLVVLCAGTSRDAPYLVAAVGGAVLGVGSGATLMPSMTAASMALVGDDVPHGTTLLNLAAQLGNALGTALTTTALTLLVTARVPGLGSAGEGGLAAMVGLGDAARSRMQPELAASVGMTYTVPLVLCLAAALAAVVGMRPTRPGVRATSGSGRIGLSSAVTVRGRPAAPPDRPAHASPTPARR